MKPVNFVWKSIQHYLIDKHLMSINVNLRAFLGLEFKKINFFFINRYIKVCRIKPQKVLSDSENHRESYLRSKWIMHKACLSVPKSEPWDISTWKKTNWRISILRRIGRIFFAWLRDNWFKVETEFFYVALNMLSNFKRVFLETMFLKSRFYKTLTLIIWLTWNLICMFQLSIATG